MGLLYSHCVCRLRPLLTLGAVLNCLLPERNPFPQPRALCVTEATLDLLTPLCTNRSLLLQMCPKKG